MKDATLNRAGSAAAGSKGRIRFRTTMLRAGKMATGIQVPDDVVAKLGSSKRPAVRITINGYTYRSTEIDRLGAAAARRARSTDEG
jgi:hypothetical protein